MGSSPPCLQDSEVNLCKSKCTEDFKACKKQKVKTKKECKATRKSCKSKCDASKCGAPPVCEDGEDNEIDGLGSAWCRINAPTPSASWCGTTEGVKKCKKTCNLC